MRHPYSGFPYSTICFFIAIFFVMFMRMDFAYAEMESQNVVVIVNYNLLHEKTLLPLEMTQKELKDIYLGNKESANGTKILLTDQKDKKILEVFISQFIGMSVSSYKSHWVKKLFSL